VSIVIILIHLLFISCFGGIPSRNFYSVTSYDVNVPLFKVHIDTKLYWFMKKSEKASNFL